MRDEADELRDKLARALEERDRALAELHYYQSAQEIITTTSGRVWIAAEKHEASLDKVLDELKQVKAQLDRANQDWAEDDTAIRNMLRPILGEFVDGDSHGVPGLPDLVEKVVELLTHKQP